MRYLAIVAIAFWFGLMMWCATKGFVLGMVLCIFAMWMNNRLFNRLIKIQSSPKN